MIYLPGSSSPILFLAMLGSHRRHETRNKVKGHIFEAVHAKTQQKNSITQVHVFMQNYTYIIYDIYY
jgi:hypothetical protein